MSYEDRDQFSHALTIIQIDRNDLLPAPEYQLAIDDRYRQAGLEQRRAYMGEAVPITPAGVVLVVAIRGRELLQCVSQVTQRS